MIRHRHDSENFSRIGLKTGVTPNDVQVIELHDCFAPNELITYEMQGLLPNRCKAGELIDRGRQKKRRKMGDQPQWRSHIQGTSTSGQPESLGSSNCPINYGDAEENDRVPNTKYAMQHNIGIEKIRREKLKNVSRVSGGAGVVALRIMADAKGISYEFLNLISNGPSLKSDVIFDEIEGENKYSSFKEPYNFLIRCKYFREKDLVDKVAASFDLVITGNGTTKEAVLLTQKPHLTTVRRK
ncbi:unnamed protein product, partial [Mesorhabditis belari]|uniref:Uncharacterized protein n=1 Tax=Mesorhabditis belari TaxID=2138241 RepID=A0AAF3ES38_9BILA